MDLELKDQKAYRDALEAAKEELLGCIRQYEELGQRIGWLRAAVASLQLVVGGSPENAQLQELQAFVGRKPDTGITSAVRYFLALNPDRCFLPAEVLEGLKSTSFKIPAYSNSHAVLSNVLTRLVSAGVVRMLPQGHKWAYQWAGFDASEGLKKRRGIRKETDVGPT